MVALLLVAVSVGLGNFAASTALGVSGVDRKLRFRVALIFGLFEGLMPLIGIALGRSLAGELGSVATPVAGALLGAVGAYSLVSGVRSGRSRAVPSETSFGRLLLIGAVLSIDNLVIGFALGAYHVGLVVAAVTIAGISVVLSLLGLEVGLRLGDRLGPWSELVGGGVLILVGVGIGTGLI